MLWLIALSCQTSQMDGQPGTWRVIWEDQFEGDANQPPDPEKWVHDVGGDGWGNNQLEFNTDSVSNVRLSGDGFLEIVARRESYESMEYTSGRIKTQGLFEQGFGRFEARIQLPEGQGLWPAFWMLGASFGEELNWPACGEIDIMEMRGDEPSIVHGTIHGPGYSGGSGIGESFSSDVPFSEEFHVYRVDVDEGHISWYVDDELFHTITRGEVPSGAPWVFDDDFFLILNLAVGGNFLDDPTEDTSFPNTMLVDYVKVYSRIE